MVPFANFAYRLSTDSATDFPVSMENTVEGKTDTKNIIKITGVNFDWRNISHSIKKVFGLLFFIMISFNSTYLPRLSKRGNQVEPVDPIR